MTLPSSKPVLGLIGAIGAGKTTAAAAFALRGGFVVDCDKLGHLALDLPNVRQQLVIRWGERVLIPADGVNRRVIAGIVFGEPTERRALEAIVFPIIGDMTRTEMTKAQADPNARFILLDAATLLEADWGKMCDKIVYIDAPRDVRLQRLAARSGWTSADLAAREAAQLPAAEKQRHAHAIITNADSPDCLQLEVDRVLQKWDLFPEGRS